jgi:hypothetical protein
MVPAVRRTEITVEREVCSIEVHGNVRLEDLTHCPVCGQNLAAPNVPSVPEAAAVEQGHGCGSDGSTLRLNDTTSSETKDERSDCK